MDRVLGSGVRRADYVAPSSEIVGVTVAFYAFGRGRGGRPDERVPLTGHICMSYMDIADLLVVTTYLKHMDTKSDGDC